MNAPSLTDIAQALADPFDGAIVQWKPSIVTGNRCLAVPFIDARDVQERLDRVLGLAGWQDEYSELREGAVLCRLSLRLGDEWITRSDVGGDSAQAAGGDRAKAAVSNALKRAAAKFGVGRYLYNVPGQWVAFDPKKKQITVTPMLPGWAIPGGMKARAEAQAQKNGARITEKERFELNELLKARGRTVEGLVKWLKLPAGTLLKDLTPQQYEAAVNKLSAATAG